MGGFQQSGTGRQRAINRGSARHRGEVKTRTLTTRQMARLKSVLEDNPVLLWGNVEGVVARAKEVGLSDLELDRPSASRSVCSSSCDAQARPQRLGLYA